jgi:hypothetical protein
VIPYICIAEYLYGPIHVQKAKMYSISGFFQTAHKKIRPIITARQMSTIVPEERPESLFSGLEVTGPGPGAGAGAGLDIYKLSIFNFS